MGEGKKQALFHYLEFTGIQNDSVFIPELKNIDTTVEIFEVDDQFGRDIFLFIDFFAHEIEDQQGDLVIGYFL